MFKFCILLMIFSMFNACVSISKINKNRLNSNIVTIDGRKVIKNESLCDTIVFDSDSCYFNNKKIPRTYIKK